MRKIDPPNREDSGFDRWRFCGASPKALAVYFWKYGQAAKGEPSQVEAYCKFPCQKSFDMYVCTIIG